MAKCEHDRQSCAVCSPEKLWKQYAYKAKKRNLTFSLTLSEFETLVNSPCHYCGEWPSNGIDRVINTIGYVNGQVKNCVSACQDCNFAKRVMVAHKFIAMCVRVAEHQKKIAEQKKAKQAELAAA